MWVPLLITQIERDAKPIVQLHFYFAKNYNFVYGSVHDCHSFPAIDVISFDEHADNDLQRQQ